MPQTLLLRTALALSGYALVSVIARTLVGTAEWQQAALRLAAWAMVWMVGPGGWSGDSAGRYSRSTAASRGLGWTTDQLPAAQAVGL